MSAKLEASGAVSWSRKAVPRIVSTIAKGLVVLAVVLQWLGLLGLGALALFFFSTVLLFVASYVSSLTQANEAGTVEVRGTDLVVTWGASQTFVRFADMVSALVVERRDSFGNTFACVDIETKRGDRLTFTPREPERARAIVEATGFGDRGRRQRTTFAKATRRLFHPVLALGLYWGAVHIADRFPGELLLPLLCVGVYELVKRALRPTVLVAGNDGLVIRRALRTTFIRRGDIAAVDSPAEGRVVILDNHGRRTTLRGFDWDAARLRAFARTILGPRGADDSAGDHVADYSRNDLPIDEWRRRLEGRSKHEDYRSLPSTTDEALGVLRSGHATPEQRVGAALAARGAGIPPERIRVAAEATVDDRVRAALQAVADDEDDVVIEKAMRRLS